MVLGKKLEIVSKKSLIVNQYTIKNVYKVKQNPKMEKLK